MYNYERFLARWKERHERLRRANDASREAIFDALGTLGVERIEISFNGYGDCGQIEDVAVAGKTERLTGEVNITLAPWTTPNEPHTCQLDDAVERLCYGLLEQEQEPAGWHHSDGAHGTFFFDVAARTVTLEYHVRYTSYGSFERTFGEA